MAYEKISEFFDIQYGELPIRSFIEKAYAELLNLTGNFYNKEARIDYWEQQVNQGLSKGDFAQEFQTQAATATGDEPTLSKEEADYVAAASKVVQENEEAIEAAMETTASPDPVTGKTLYNWDLLKDKILEAKLRPPAEQPGTGDGNDDITFTVTADTDEITEGNLVTFEVISNRTLEQDTNLDYTITGVNGAGIDVPLTGTITIPADHSWGSLDINALTDDEIEGTETLTLTLDDYEISDSVDILDASEVPGQTPTFDQTISVPLDGDITYPTAGGSAADGDYQFSLVTDNDPATNTSVATVIDGFGAGDAFALPEGTRDGISIATNGADALTIVVGEFNADNWIIDLTSIETTTVDAVNAAVGDQAKVDELKSIWGDWLGDGDVQTPTEEMTVSITADEATFDEGDQASFTVTASEAVAEDTIVNYSIEGTNITADDIVGGALTGSTTINAGQTSANVSFDLAADQATEGSEDMTVSLDDYTSSDAVIINDTSVAPGDVTQYDAVVTLQEGEFYNAPDTEDYFNAADADVQFEIPDFAQSSSVEIRNFGDGDSIKLPDGTTPGLTYLDQSASTATTIVAGFESDAGDGTWLVQLTESDQALADNIDGAANLNDAQNFADQQWGEWLIG